jgi:hypothetical protein
LPRAPVAAPIAPVVASVAPDVGEIDLREEDILDIRK